MYKKLLVVVASAVTFGLIGSAYGAAELVITPVMNFTVTPEAKPKVKKQDNRPVSMREFFTQYCNRVGAGVPDIFRQIPLKISDVKRDNPLYSALQRCVYLGFVPNAATSYQRNSSVTSRFVNVLISKNLRIDPNVNEDVAKLTRQDFGRLIDSLPTYGMLLNVGVQSKWGLNGNYNSQLIQAEGFDVLTQIYQSLKSDYRTGYKATDEVLIQGAIK